MKGVKQTKTRGSKTRLSRALGVALTTKAARYTERRPYGPGQHGRDRKRTTDYRERLVEKQRLRAQYHIDERKMRTAVRRAVRSRLKTGKALLIDLETRLDALVLRAGFAGTIYRARQAVGHGHITVNGRKVDVSSYRVRPGGVIEVAERSRPMPPFEIAATGVHAAATPPYLHVDHPARDRRS